VDPLLPSWPRSGRPLPRRGRRRRTHGSSSSAVSSRSGSRCGIPPRYRALFLPLRVCSAVWRFEMPHNSMRCEVMETRNPSQAYGILVSLRVKSANFMMLIVVSFAVLGYGLRGFAYAVHVWNVLST